MSWRNPSLVGSTTGMTGMVCQMFMWSRIGSADRTDEYAQIDALAAQPRSGHCGLLGQLCGIHLVGVGGQLGEVGQLADLKRADQVVPVQSSRSIDGVGA